MVKRAAPDPTDVPPGKHVFELRRAEFTCAVTPRRSSATW